MKNIPYARQSIDRQDINVVSDVLSSDFLTQGPKVREFEARIADYCGVSYAVSLNSGTSALHAACFAVGIKKGDEVITSAITFAASANCVLYCGGRPVFCDVSGDTINIAEDKIKEKISKKTRAIIPVHFAGHPSELAPISRIAKENNLFVIEDAAHALGARYRGSKIGDCKYSDITVLSFHAIKHITTGEGGMLLTNNKEYFKKALAFRSHGITKDKEELRGKNKGDWYYEMRYLGYNYRLTDFQCALGISQLKKLGQFIQRRREIVNRYNGAFRGNRNIALLPERGHCKSACHIYVILVKGDRKLIFDSLKRSGVGVNVHYLPVYLHPYYRALGYKKGLCRNAEEYYQRAITLPLYPGMTDRQVSSVINKVNHFVRINE